MARKKEPEKGFTEAHPAPGIWLVEKPKRGPAKYRVRVFAGTDGRTGRKLVITRTVVGFEEAKALRAELEGEKRKGRVAGPSKEPFAAYVLRWLAEEKEGRIRARTVEGYRSIIRRTLENPPPGAPPLGAIRLSRLDRQDFKRFYDFLWRERGLHPETVKKVHALFRQALEHAVDEGELGRNPTDRIKAYSEVVPEQGAQVPEGDEEDSVTFRAMSEEEASRFLQAARADRYYPLFLFLLTTGARPGEAFGLLWRDVDLGAGKVSIRRALVRRGLAKGVPWRLEKPKTRKAVRTLDLPPVTVAALREWRSLTGRERLQAGAEYQDKGFVFCGPFGAPLEGGNVYGRNFRRVMAAAGLGTWEESPRLARRPKDATGKPKRLRGPLPKPVFKPAHRLYDLRHTAATLWLKKGIHVKVVSEMLGHAKVSLTLDIYSHVLPGMQEGAAKAMEAAFGGL